MCIQINGDLILCVSYYIASRAGLLHFVSGNGTMMSGLVGEMRHQVLPNVSPLATVATTIAAMAVHARVLVQS